MSATKSYGKLPQAPSVASGIISGGWALISYGSKPVAIYGKGDYFDESLFVPPIRHTAIVAVSIDHQPVEPTHGVEEDLVRCLARHAARLSASALVRTADFLVELGEKIDSLGAAPLTIELPLSQYQLAELLGVSAVHMNRTLQHLKKLGFIRYGKGHFTLVNRAALGELAGDLYIE